VEEADTTTTKIMGNNQAIKVSNYSNWQVILVIED